MINSPDIKSSLYKLIEKTDNNELLEIVYRILNSRASDTEGEAIKGLSAEQKEELNKAYNDSLDESELINLKQFKENHEKWLGK